MRAHPADTYDIASDMGQMEDMASCMQNDLMWILVQFCWLNPRAVRMFGIIGEQDWAKDSFHKVRLVCKHLLREYRCN